MFESVIQGITESHFPLISVRQRSNEDPWITNGIRRRAKKKRRLYRRRGRTAAWKKTDADLQADISEKRQEFVEKLLQDPAKNYYRAVKQLGAPGTKREWSVRDLFLGDSAQTAGAEVLEFFSNVRGDGQPMEIPPTPSPGPPDAGLGVFDVPRVTKLLQGHKKVRSTVEGDPMPHLVRKFPELFAVPVAKIFNSINETGRWPVKWKKEPITVIPKNPKPSGLAECRNISCTLYLSKVLEGVLLQKLRQELVVDPDQYGGEKGCGDEHMIVEIWDRILSVMDEGDAAACLLGLDFEKTFNRMDHGQCLKQLRILGASESSIMLVKSFHHGREMSVTIDGIYCGTRKIVRVTTQGLTQPRPIEGSLPLPPTNVSGPPPLDSVFEDVPPLPRPDSTPGTRFFSGSDSDDLEGVNFWDNSSSFHSYDGGGLGADSLHSPYGSWTEVLDKNGVVTFKYVDDTTAFEAVPMNTAVKHLSTGPTVESVYPAGLERALVDVAESAEEIGMRVNVKKTQLLCISPNNSSITSACVRAEEGDIWSGPTMKLVGFTFSSSPTAEAHIIAIREEYRRKVWFLFHLREAGVKGINLYKLYYCYIRSRIEYLSAAYLSMLLKGQSGALERLHRHALRVCFGFIGDIRATMAYLAIDTLQERRERRSDAFITKAARNPRFQHWFPLRPVMGMQLRRRREIEEVK